MARKVRGVLNPEGVQTGDSRIIVANATEWAEPPLPIAWLQRQQHGDLLDGAVAVGTFSTIAREGNLITFEGEIDEARPEGAEMVRRMEDGTAPKGNRWPLSIDPDNWAVQIVDTTGGSEDETVVITASGDQRLDFRMGNTLRSRLLRKVPAMAAAAGDPDIEPTADQIWFEDEAGAILERFTRLRTRGVTAVDIGAFHEAYMELIAVDAATEGEPAEAAPAEAAVTAAALVHAAPSDLRVHPPDAWFHVPEPDESMSGMTDVYGMPAQELLVEQPDGGLGVPLVITDDGQVYGHAARWGQPHKGFLTEWVLAPESTTNYAYFHIGEVHSAEGTRIATGPLIVGCEHADLMLGIRATRDHYAHSGMGWADARASNGRLGLWVCGALRPDVTEAQVRVLRALALSGDWREAGTSLEFVTALAVNVPGFPVAREAVTASGLYVGSAPSSPVVRVGQESPTALTAAGLVRPRCSECEKRRAMAASARSDAEMMDLLRGMSAKLDALDLRTRHLRQAALRDVLERIEVRNGQAKV